MFIGLDTETTGVDPSRARVVQIATSVQSPGFDPKGATQLLNPEQRIPPSASAVHKITDEMVADKPTLPQSARQITALLGSACDPLAVASGYNIRKYDWPLLQARFAEIGVVIPTPQFVDVHDLVCWHFRHLRSRKLSAVAAHLGIPFDEGEAHDALNDVSKSFEVLNKIRTDVLKLPDTLAGDIELIRLCTLYAIRNDAEWNSFGAVVYRDRETWGAEDAPFRLGIGKNAGMLLSELREREPRYCNWLVRDVLPTCQPAVWDAFRASGFDDSWGIPKPRALERA